MRRATSSILLVVSAATLLASTVLAQSCNATVKCGSAAPCCSEYGFCGKGSYCLQGCEPLHSFSLDSCKPNALCQSQTTTFTSLDRVQTNASLWNGNVSAYDWVVNSGSLIPTADGARLTLNQTNGGTKISSTRYVHYGKIDFVLETSKWQGVVTAAITMSDVKDEIDWEWPGTNTSFVQTNYWFLGIANYSQTQGQASRISSDSSSNFHTYTFDWQPDYLNWLIDGQVVRTVNKVDTLSANGWQYQYPSTPSRVQLSIWPGGSPNQAQGTIDWAGGLIDWQDPDYVANGYFWNTVKSVSVTCNQNANQTSQSTGWSYTGNDTHGVPAVSVTNASLISSATPTWTGGRTSVVLLAGGAAALALAAGSAAVL